MKTTVRFYARDPSGKVVGKTYGFSVEGEPEEWFNKFKFLMEFIKGEGSSFVYEEVVFNGEDD